MEKNLQNKLAVVTGASRGIGFHIAKILHDAGANVAVCARTKESIDRTAQKIGERCSPFVCDLRNPKSIESFSHAVLTDLGTPDVLVNNAGISRYIPFLEMTLEQWNEIVETNLTGTFLMTRAFLPPWSEKTW